MEAVKIKNIALNNVDKRGDLGRCVRECEKAATEGNFEVEVLVSDVISYKVQTSLKVLGYNVYVQDVTVDGVLLNISWYHA